MNKAEQFCKLNGICWHEIEETEYGDFQCRKCQIEIRKRVCNPTFTDAKSILEVMMKREDDEKFIVSIGQWFDNININYILNPDKLLDEAIKFCEKKNP